MMSMVTVVMTVVVDDGGADNDAIDDGDVVGLPTHLIGYLTT